MAAKDCVSETLGVIRFVRTCRLSAGLKAGTMYGGQAANDERTPAGLEGGEKAEGQGMIRARSLVRSKWVRPAVAYEERGYAGLPSVLV